MLYFKKYSDKIIKIFYNNSANICVYKYFNSEALCNIQNTIPNLQKKYDINYISIYWMIKIKSFERKACIG